MMNEVIVVGGSVAGLSVALVLAQARRDVLVVDAGEPRNAPSAQLHGYLGHDGDAPSTLLQAGRDEVRDHGGQLREGTVTAAARTDGGFVVDLADGVRISSRVLVIATGLIDHLPEIPGLAAGWGQDVVHCPYCHGVEVADLAIGVIGGTAMDAFRAQLVRQWSSDVTLFSDGATVSDEERDRLAARNIEVVDGAVQRLERDPGGKLRGVALEGEQQHACQAVFVWAPPEPRDALLRQLGVETDELEMFGTWPRIGADGRTEVPGLWAVGNVSDPRLNLIAATAHGAYAAAMINHELITQDVDAAMEARSA